MKANTLSLLAHKVASNMFDISSGLTHVSLRDQLIRGTTLVRDLISTEQLDGTYSDILIVGAGAGGIAAALAAAAGGKRVLVIDTGDMPFRLQRNAATRYVGPYMYEWPSLVYNDQRLPPRGTSALSAWADNGSYAGLTIPSANPITANELVKHWDMELQNSLDRHAELFTVLTGVDGKASKGEILRWLKGASKWHRRRPPQLLFYGTNWRTGARITKHINPRFTILAAGLGPERTTWSNNRQTFTGDKFWEWDSLRNYNCGLPSHLKARIAVFGGGDGALQDTLRCLMICEEPLGFIAKLEQNLTASVKIKESITKILLIEQQHSLVRTWTNGAKSNEDDTLQKAYMQVITPLASTPEIRSTVFSLLRSDVNSVDMIVSENSLGKAYALNRFLVLLIDECYRNNACPPPPECPKFRLHFNSELDNIGILTSGRRRTLTIVHRDRDQDRATSSTLDVTHIVIRGGVEKQLSPGKLIGITKKDSENRGELALIPQPLWPFL